MQVAVMARGRPRKRNTDRQPDGRVRPQKIGPTQETLDRRAAELAPLIARYPDMVAIPLARDPDAEWYIGRLRLVGLLTVEQRDAADAYQRVIERYARFLKGPKQPAALDLMRRDGGHDGEETNEEKKEFKRVRRAYERRWDAIAAHGHEVVRAVTRALRGEECNIDLLRRGLDALVTGKFGA